VAATNLAKRLDAEYSSQEKYDMVSYITSKEKSKNKNTPIQFVTEGVLLNMINGDENFTKFDCIILDETHERGVNTDILMGLLKIRLNKSIEKNLKVIIMSATICSKDFETYYTIINKEKPSNFKVNYLKKKKIIF
jgi:HrpA-like RNA helicase